MLIGDIILIPVKPGVMDVWATQKLLQYYENTKMFKDNVKAFFVLNQVDSRTKIMNEVLDALKEFELETLKSKLNNRIAYSECVKGGIGVYEYTDQKARKEIIQLTNEILDLVK